MRTTWWLNAYDGPTERWLFRVMIPGRPSFIAEPTEPFEEWDCEEWRVSEDNFNELGIDVDTEADMYPSFTIQLNIEDDEVH